MVVGEINATFNLHAVQKMCFFNNSDAVNSEAEEAVAIVGR